MTFSPKTPQFVIPTKEIGAVVYPEKKAVGIQFVDPAGGHVFVTIPGSLVPLLANSLKEAAERHPEILAWPPAPYSSAR